MSLLDKSTASFVFAPSTASGVSLCGANNVDIAPQTFQRCLWYCTILKTCTFWTSLRPSSYHPHLARRRVSQRHLTRPIRTIGESTTSTPLTRTRHLETFMGSALCLLNLRPFPPNVFGVFVVLMLYGQGRSEHRHRCKSTMFPCPLHQLTWIQTLDSQRFLVRPARPQVSAHERCSRFHRGQSYITMPHRSY